jgi:uncharacterized membrane protein YoaT (DUF817 family)
VVRCSVWLLDVAVKIVSAWAGERGRVSWRAVSVKAVSVWRAVLLYAVVLEASVRTVNCRVAVLGVDSVRSVSAIMESGVEDAR